MLKRLTLYPALATCLILYGSYLCAHYGFVRAALSHMFVRPNFLVVREILVYAPAEQETGADFSPDDFHRLAASPEAVFHRNVTYVTNLPFPIERLGQKVLFLQWSDRMERPWAGLRLITLDAGQRGRGLVRVQGTETLLDIANLTVLASAGRKQYYVFYKTADDYEKGLRFLAYLRVAHRDPRVRFTTDTLPLSSLPRAEQEPFRFLGGREVMAFAAEEGEIVESYLGSLLFRDDGGLIPGTGLQHRYGGVSVEAGPGGVLELRGREGALIARFTDYGFSCGDGMLLYGTFFEPAERRGYLAVSYGLWQGENTALLDSALCWIEAEAPEVSSEASRKCLLQSYGGVVMRLEQSSGDSRLTYRFHLAEEVSDAAIMLRYCCVKLPASVSLKIDGREAGAVLCDKTQGDLDFQIAWGPIGSMAAGDHTLEVVSDRAISFDCFAVIAAPAGDWADKGEAQSAEGGPA